MNYFSLRRSYFPPKWNHSAKSKLYANIPQIKIEYPIMLPYNDLVLLLWQMEIYSHFIMLVIVFYNLFRCHSAHLCTDVCNTSLVGKSHKCTHTYSYLQNINREVLDNQLTSTPVTSLYTNISLLLFGCIYIKIFQNNWKIQALVKPCIQNCSLN